MPNSVFLYGHSGSGKSTVLDYMAGQWQDNNRLLVAQINCLECFTPKLLFEHALAQWFPLGRKLRCDHFGQFVWAIRALLEGKGEDGTGDGDGGGLILILDRAEKLRTTMPTVFSALLRLHEILNYGHHASSSSIIKSSVILVSSIVWERFRSPFAVSDPILIHFDDYKREEIFDIVRLKLSQSSLLHNHPKLYDVFMNLLYSIFHASCKDLNEYLYLAKLLYPIYIRPVMLKQCKLSKLI